MPATKVKKRNVTKKSSAKKHIKERRMGISEIRMKAKGLGIIPGTMNKEELIHTIQATEGYTACFGRSNGECGYTNCCFIKDCFRN